MAAKMDFYRHLNNDHDGFTVDIESYAARLEGLTYGVHRMLSAIARNRLAKDPADDIGKGIRDLLNTGAF